MSRLLIYILLILQVVPPCQFEIHACKAYRRASQYICLENGKSLLDVVKECRKSSVKTLEETVENFVGPLPVKESVFCQNCEGEFGGNHMNSCLFAVTKEGFVYFVYRLISRNICWERGKTL